MRQGGDTCTQFIEKVIDACRYLFKLDQKADFTDDQFHDVKAIILGGINLRARDHLINTNPTDVEGLTAAGITASFLEKQDNGRNDSSILAIKTEMTKQIAPLKEQLRALSQKDDRNGGNLTILETPQKSRKSPE